MLYVLSESRGNVDWLYFVETSGYLVHHCSDNHSIGWIACCDMELCSECYMCMSTSITHL